MTTTWMAIAMTAASISQATEVTLERFSMEIVSPTRLRLHLVPSGNGAWAQSCGMRTTAPDADDSLPGFISHGRYLYLASDREEGPGRWMLLDNTVDDADPDPGAWELFVSTEGWPDGMHDFLVYADNRPGPGTYKAARKRIRVTIADGQIDEHRSGERRVPVLAVKGFEVSPDAIRPGENVSVRLDLDVQHASPEDVTASLRTPYTVSRDEAPPGFEYDPETKLAVGPEIRGGNSVLLRTDDWTPGVVHLTCEAEVPGWGDSARVYRDVAIEVRPPRPRVLAAVVEDRFLKPGTHFGTMCLLGPRTVLAHGMITQDAGQTWTALPHDIPMAHALPDGSVLGLGMRSDPLTDKPGWFEATGYRTTQALETVTTFDANLHVPEATRGVGHAPYPGPILWRSIVPLPDGTLLAAAYGWFEGDRSPVPGQPGSMRYRTYVLRSLDQGRTWSYLSTVAYDPHIGTEGFCEPVIRRLPNGDLYALLRTGGNNRPYHQDNPLCWTRSTDNGKTWSEPKRTGMEGVSPDLCVMHDGTLACSYGRPGADLMFSLDNGETWSDHFSIDPERYSGYTALCEVEPGLLVYGYGAMNRLNTETGRREDHLRIARVRVRTIE